MDADAKEKSLEIGLAAIRKEWGKDSVFLGSDKVGVEIERIPTGSIALDLATSGGYAKGRIIEIYGPEAAGKTTLALNAIVECQKTGGRCAFIDMEHALNVSYVSQLGINPDKLIIAQPDSAEQALGTVQQLTHTGALDLIVLDSVAGLCPQKELEGNIGDSTIGLTARLMGQTCRSLAGAIHKTNTTVIFINQIRMKINAMFSSPETRPGGRALGYFASQVLDIRRIKTLTSGEEKIGITAQVKVAKSKVGPPFKTAQLNIMFGSGIDTFADVVDTAISFGVVHKAGAWFSYKGNHIGQGLQRTASFLKENPDVLNEIKREIFKKADIDIPATESEGTRKSSDELL